MPRGGNWVWIRVDPKIKAAKDKVKNKRYIRLHINLLYGYGQYFDGIYRDIDILSSATLAELHGRRLLFLIIVWSRQRC